MWMAREIPVLVSILRTVQFTVVYQTEFKFPFFILWEKAAICYHQSCTFISYPLLSQLMDCLVFIYVFFARFELFMTV